MAELGETRDPRELVPGEPAGVDRYAGTLGKDATGLDEAGEAIANLSPDGWTGPASERFHEWQVREAEKWRVAADATRQAAEALDAHGAVLGSAQAQAADAIALYEEGERATAAAKAEHTDAVQDAWLTNEHNAATGNPARVTVPPFSDPGEALRAQARELLERAREQVDRSGAAAVATLAAAREKAHFQPSVFEVIGNLVQRLSGTLPGGATGLFDWLGQLGPRFAADGNEVRKHWGPIDYLGDLDKVIKGGMPGFEFITKIGKVWESGDLSGVFGIDGKWTGDWVDGFTGRVVAGAHAEGDAKEGVEIGPWEVNFSVDGMAGGEVKANADSAIFNPRVGGEFFFGGKVGPKADFEFVPGVDVSMGAEGGIGISEGGTVSPLPGFPTVGYRDGELQVITGGGIPGGPFTFSQETKVTVDFDDVKENADRVGDDVKERLDDLGDRMPWNR
jgi:uncharacterized protein YukE